MNKNGYIGLKWGTLKCWHFSKEFCNKNKDLVKEFDAFYDSLYENTCCAIGSSEYIKDKENLKHDLINYLNKFYDLGVEIYNDFDNEKYKTKNSYKKYILEYGKELNWKW